MKTILFLRHGKSSWKEEGIDDTLRQLKSSGIQEIIEVSTFFKEKNLCVDKIISSPAVRAYSTAMIFMNLLSIPNKILTIDSNIYESTPSLIIKVIQKNPDTINSILIVGHNPSISSTIEHLTANAYNELPTGALVALQTSSESWKEIKKNSCKKIFDIIPSRHFIKDEHNN